MFVLVPCQFPELGLEHVRAKLLRQEGGWSRPPPRILRPIEGMTSVPKECLPCLAPGCLNMGFEKIGTWEVCGGNHGLLTLGPWGQIILLAVGPHLETRGEEAWPEDLSDRFRMKGKEGRLREFPLAWEAEMETGKIPALMQHFGAHLEREESLITSGRSLLFCKFHRLELQGRHSQKVFNEVLSLSA